MLTTKQKVLRRFWYAVMPLDDLAAGPKPFRLLGEDIVLFLGADGKPAALKDRCCHRTSKLSKGWCKDGQIVCGYHGWTYDRTGKLVHVPQFPVQQEVPNLSTPAYHCDARYGYAWVALDEPLAPILDAVEENDHRFRRIPQFYEVWNTCAFRLMENSFDNAHFAFVHKGTFGQLSQPLPEKYEIKETDYGFEAETIITTANPPVQYRISGTTDRPPSATCATSGSCRSAASSISSTRPGFATSSSTRRRRSTTTISRSCSGSIATTPKPTVRPRS